LHQIYWQFRKVIIVLNIPHVNNLSLLKQLVAPAQPTEVFCTYWRFAAERQRIFFNRIQNASDSDWTSDPIFLTYKFTNAYRASDRVSQYLIRNVIYAGDQSPEEVFFRVILFKFFNRIETWELLEKHFGEIRYSEYSFRHYDEVLTNARQNGKRIYSAAYIMPSGNRFFGHSVKHRNNLRLLETMMDDELPLQLNNAKSMKQAFEMLRSYPTMGDFLAYQYVTDLNYSNMMDFSEMEFVIPGPGCMSGMRKCFNSLGGFTEANVIRRISDNQVTFFQHLDLDFKDLWGRKLQLIDCQNLFCEVDKYARIAHPEVKGQANRIRIKQKYKPNLNPIRLWYPPKWKINKKLGRDAVN
jgi:hypothetical protein